MSRWTVMASFIEEFNASQDEVCGERPQGNYTETCYQKLRAGLASRTRHLNLAVRFRPCGSDARRGLSRDLPPFMDEEF
ncbi:hypothetical protein O9929_15545 [Vibrio lentus]|nr:hypothetical protein [Vibrio lentus]